MRQLPFILCTLFWAGIALPTVAQEAESDAPKEKATKQKEKIEKTEIKKKTVDPTGTWHYERDFQGQQLNGMVMLTLVDERKLEGSVKIGNNDWKIEDGKVIGDQLSFVVKNELQGREFTSEYSGKIKDDTLEGKVVFSIADRELDLDWEAQRKVMMEDVVGSWEMKVGPYTVTLNITKKDDKYSGVLVLPNGKERPIQELAIKENQLTFVAELTLQGNDVKLSFSGRPIGDHIKAGEVDLSGRRQMEFNAKRMKVSKK